MSIIRQFLSDGHDVRLIVEATDRGWDVREQVDASTVHREHHDDWHRVERALYRLEDDVLHRRITAVAIG